jgi:hypothetical protein
MRQVIPAPTPAGSTDGPVPNSVGDGKLRSRSWIRENLEHSLPFILGGALCVGLAVWLHLGQPHVVSSRLSLWILLAAVGVTLAGGGLALTLVDEPQAQVPPDREGDYVMVTRSEWDQWQSGGASPASGAPREEPPQPWDEANPEAVGGSPSPPPAPTAAPYDPGLVATASEDLLRAQRPTVAGGPTGPAAASVTTERPEAPPGSVLAPGLALGAPAGPSPGPARGGEAGPTPRPPIAPAWQEDAIQELESVLEQFGGDATARPTGAAPQRPQISIDRCIACGAAVTGYSEQACVVCDRPLCDRCLERSVAEGRPAVCPLCPAPPEG